MMNTKFIFLKGQLIQDFRFSHSRKHHKLSHLTQRGIIKCTSIQYTFPYNVKRP